MSAVGRFSAEMGTSARFILTLAGATTLPLLVLACLVAASHDQPAGWLILPSVALAGLAVIASFIVVRALTYRSERAIRQIQRIVRRLASGDYTGPVQALSISDLHEVSADLSTIAERLDKLQAELDILEVRRDYELSQRKAELDGRLHENERLRTEARALHEFVAAITRILDPTQIGGQLLTSVEAKVNYTLAAVFLENPNTGELEPIAISDRDKGGRWVGQYVRELPNLAETSGRSCATWVAHTGRALLVADTQEDRRYFSLRPELRSVLAIPLVVKERVLGIIQLADRLPSAYSKQDEQFVSFLANEAAMAIENVRLLEEAAKVEAFRELDRLKSELLSTVSHELRTPLAMIKGYTTTLLRQDVDWAEEDRRDFLQIIDEESDRLRALIDDLLQMSEIEAGILRISKQPLALSKLAQRVVRRARLNSSEHSITTSFPTSLPSVDADPKRIEQVFTNLVHNAIKYSPEGGAIRVRGLGAHVQPDGELAILHSTPWTEQSTWVVIAIADEGIGIEADQADRIFDRFYRVDGQLTRQTGGSGLGLSICKGIIEAHGGRIWVESPGVTVRASTTGNRGSTFYFALPASNETDPVVDDVPND